MTLDRLLQERRIYRQKIASADILAVIARAESDIDSAQYMLKRDPDWAFSIAYNSVLQASRALMFSRGFRPSSHEGHKNTFAFLRAVAEEDRRTLVDFFDRMRVKRHQAVYETAGLITRIEAETLIEQAQSFITWVKGELDKQAPLH